MSLMIFFLFEFGFLGQPLQTKYLSPSDWYDCTTSNVHHTTSEINTCSLHTNVFPFSKRIIVAVPSQQHASSPAFL